MNFKIDHLNFNVANYEKSLAFYKEALGLKVVKEKQASDESFKLFFLSDTYDSPYLLELTWLKNHPQAYDLGELEYHLASRVDDYEAAFKKHTEMGCVAYVNEKMGIYFITDPDGYWIEIVPLKRN